MISIGPAGWSRSLVVAVDVLVGIWLVAMVGLGLLAMMQINRLGTASDSLLEISKEEHDLADALAPLRQLPLAGDRIATAQQDLEQASAASAKDAADSRSSLHALSSIAFALVLLLALFPVFAFYVPMRVTRYASTRSLGRRRRAPS
jgi:hypothetical protein